MSIIEFDSVRYTYDGTAYALDGIDLQIAQGEFVCVLGGNGSGKSTLAKHINALLAPDEGAVRILDRNTRDQDSIYFIRSNAGMVFQNPDDQIVASIIEDDVAFGPENLGIPLPELRERVTNALEQVGLQGFEARETSALSGGQKQRVAIAGVLAMAPKILVLDEASAMLDPRGRAGLLRVCRELNAAGLTIVYITHFMEESVGADRIIVMDAGHIALEGTPNEVLIQVDRLKELHLDVPFAAQMSFALRDRGVTVALHVSDDELEEELVPQLGEKPDKQPFQHLNDTVDHRPSDAKTPSVQPSQHLDAHDHHSLDKTQSTPSVIQLENVSFTYEPTPNKRRRRKAAEPSSKPAKWGNDPNEHWALRNVSITIRQGDFLGLAGHTGSGKSTLIQLAAGLLQPNTGHAILAGTDLGNKKAAREARGNVGLVFQYPERQLFAASVFDDVAFGPRNLGLSSNEVENRVSQALDMVHLSLDDLRDRSPFALSGGQQRRIAIAGVLAMEPRILIMDEPTAGLDPQSREALLALIRELHDTRGLTVVLVSHSMDDLARLCNRIAVLNRGELVAEGAPIEVFADEKALKDIGLSTPRVLHWAHLLGIETSNHIPSIDELADALAQRMAATHG